MGRLTTPAGRSAEESRSISSRLGLFEPRDPGTEMRQQGRIGFNRSSSAAASVQLADRWNKGSGGNPALGGPPPPISPVAPTRDFTLSNGDGDIEARGRSSMTTYNVPDVEDGPPIITMGRAPSRLPSASTSSLINRWNDPVQRGVAAYHQQQQQRATNIASPSFVQRPHQVQFRDGTSKFAPDGPEWDTDGDGNRRAVQRRHIRAATLATQAGFSWGVASPYRARPTASD